MTHAYKKHGATTLFAALSMLDGKAVGDCMPRGKQRKFSRVLKKIDAEIDHVLALHLIADNYSPLKHPELHFWLRQ